MRVFYKTFGCKANQYDTERMRQEIEALGAHTASDLASADVCVVNTCTVTNQADADARRYVARTVRERPGDRETRVGAGLTVREADDPVVGEALVHHEER